MSHLIEIYAVCKFLSLVVKELKERMFSLAPERKVAHISKSEGSTLKMHP